MKLRLLAPAKINLCLHILGQRPDGYHELESLVAFTDIGDYVEVATADTLTIEATGPFADRLPENMSENLIWRAAKSLQDYFALESMPGALIKLEKNLPVSSGIGSGSTDAAAALRLLCKLWNLAPPADAWRWLGAGLGADVLACLEGLPTLMRGIGEELDPMPLPACMPAVLVHPGKGLQTVDVYAARKGEYDQPILWPEEFFDQQQLVDFLKHTRNGLQASATKLLPQVAQVLSALAQYPGCGVARMSGSGPTCFALFETVAQAEKAALALSAIEPQWWIRSVVINPDNGT